MSDFGCGFRAARSTETGFRFVIRSNGAWYLLPSGQEPIDSGTTASYDQLPGAANTIELLARGKSAIVVINGVVLKQLDLSSITIPGGIYLGTGFFNGDTIPGRQALYTDWWVYPIGMRDVKSG